MKKLLIVLSLLLILCGCQKKENIEKFKDIYDVSVKVIANENIKQGKLKVNILKTYSDFLDDEKVILR